MSRRHCRGACADPETGRTPALCGVTPAPTARPAGDRSGRGPQHTVDAHPLAPHPVLAGVLAFTALTVAQLVLRDESWPPAPRPTPTR